MIYSDAIALFNRQPTILVKITVPGTITGTQTFYFSPNNGKNISNQIGKDVRTYLNSWSGRSAKILPNLSDTERSRYTLTMREDNNPPDFDPAVFTVYSGGAFWRRLVATQPNYMGSVVEILRGFVDDAFPETSFQRVFIGSLVEINFDVDTVSVIAKDNSVSFSNNMPAEISDANLLNGAIASTDTAIVVSDAVQYSDPANWTSKDCLPMQIRINPESIPVLSTNAGWTASGNKLTQAGKFSTYTFTLGDKILLTHASVTTDPVEIIGKLDNDTIILKDRIYDSDIANGIAVRPREDINISASNGTTTLTVLSNYAKMSEDFSDVVWGKTGSTVSSGIGVSPWGGTGTADQITLGAAVSNVNQTSDATSSGDDWVFSVWLKSSSTATVGTIVISLWNTLATYTYRATLTTNWQRFQVTGSMTGASAIHVAIERSLITDTTGIYAWGACVQPGATRGFYTPTNKGSTSPIPGAYAGRGIAGTSASAHGSGAAMKEIINYCPPMDATHGLHPIFILRDLLNKAGVPVADVDETYFGREFAFIESVEMRRAGPFAVTSSRIDELIGDVRENGMIDLWVSESGLFRCVYGFRANVPGVTSTLMTDETNIILKSATIQSNKAQSMFTRVYVYYDLIGGMDGSDRRDYNSVHVVINFAAEQNVEPIVKVVLAKWIYRKADAVSLAGRTVSRFKQGARILSVSMDLKDDLSFNVGDYFQLDSVDAMKVPKTGTAVIRGTSNWELIQKTDNFTSGQIKIEAMEARGLRYAIICANGYPDYDAATPAQQQYGFIGTAANLVGVDGDDGYYIL